MERLFSLTLRPRLIGLLVVFSLIVVACGSSAGSGTPTAGVPATGAGSVQVADNSEFGKILVTTDGKTLYTNTVDTPENLRCTNIACTGFWAPYLVNAEPTAVAEIQGTLGTVTRPDGNKQLTYNQQPLYTFYLDKQPGDTKGNGFTDFGGTWHVVTLGSTPGENNNNTTSEPGGIHY